MSSMKDSNEIINSASWALPSRLYLGNYTDAWASAGIGSAYISSIIVTVVTLILEVCVTCFAGRA
jgi:ABC-type glycerol-3-phosphate transport system permease component